MINNKIGWIIGGLVVILFGVTLWMHFAPSPAPPSGSVDTFAATPYQCNGDYCYWYVAAQCGQPAGTIASSTLFSVQNPFNATSTLTFASISGIQGATTTDILVGTSTTAAPLGLSVNSTTTALVGQNTFAMYSVTAGSRFFSSAGVTMGPGTGYKAPSGGTYPTSQAEIVMGPSEYLVGFSTSTLGGATNGGLGATQIAVPASCAYELEFTRSRTMN